MNYFDTNVLIYAFLEQNQKKTEISQGLISKNIDTGTFAISTLSLQELVFVLSKNGYEMDDLTKVVKSFLPYCMSYDQNAIFLEAFELCSTINFCKNINDSLHIKIAQKECKKLITFDTDFEKLKQYTNIEIEILSI